MPNDNNDKIQPVPNVPQVCMLSNEKSTGNYFDEEFDCKYSHKDVAISEIVKSIVMN